MANGLTPASRRSSMRRLFSPSDSFRRRVWILPAQDEQRTENPTLHRSAESAKEPTWTVKGNSTRYLIRRCSGARDGKKYVFAAVHLASAVSDKLCSGADKGMHQCLRARGLIQIFRVLAQVVTSEDNIVMMGDFNIDLKSERYIWEGLVAQQAELGNQVYNQEALLAAVLRGSSGITSTRACSTEPPARLEASVSQRRARETRLAMRDVDIKISRDPLFGAVGCDWRIRNRKRKSLGRRKSDWVSGSAKL